MFLDANTLENIVEGIKDALEATAGGSPTYYCRVYQGTSASDPATFNPATHSADLLATWSISGGTWRTLTGTSALVLTYSSTRTATASAGSATAPTWGVIYDSADGGTSMATYAIIGPVSNTNDTGTFRIWNETTESTANPPTITSGDTVRLDEVTFTLTDSLA